MLVSLRAASAQCGAKAHTLGRLLRAGFPVPDGFVVPDALGDAGWEQQIHQAVCRLDAPRFAVRSSALGEDSAGASFAGQLHTTLGATTTAEVVAAVRRSAGSGTSREAAAYTTRTGHALAPTIPVIVQAMVQPDAAGVLFTQHPVTGADRVVIEAARGLGDQVVDGTVAPHAWVIDGEVPIEVDAAENPVLTPDQVLALTATGRRIEAHLGMPQDVEWAITGDDVWVLQARPITTSPAGAERDENTPGDVLVTGTAASPGTATGPVRIIRGLDRFGRFRAGEVLVCHTTSPAWTPLLARAAAVVTETGGMLAHAAIVAREFNIPAVVAAPNATTVLTDGQEVVVDGTHGDVIAAPAPGRT